MLIMMNSDKKKRGKALKCENFNLQVELLIFLS